MKRVKFSRKEVSDLLSVAAKVLEDMGLSMLADRAEQAMLRVNRGMSAKDTAIYSEWILPRGKRGHIRLVLSLPNVARAYALIAGLLRSMSDEG